MESAGYYNNCGSKIFPAYLASIIHMYALPYAHKTKEYGFHVSILEPSRILMNITRRMGERIKMNIFDDTKLYIGL